jgi:hypothetical protein
LVPAQVLFETWGKCRYATTDGRWLEVGTGNLAGDMLLRYEFRDTEKTLPIDAIACEFRTAGREGRIWATTSRFTTRLFIAHMFDFSLAQHMNLFRPSEADEDYKRAFERGLMLEGARFSSDDRFYRTLLVGEELIVTKFKYTQITFDVAVVQDEQPSYLTQLAIRVHSESLWDNDVEDVGELGFYMSCLHPLRYNTAVFDAGSGYWRDCPLPMPLVFSETGARGLAQDNVRIVG